MRALPKEEHRAKALQTGIGKEDVIGENLELALKDGCDLKSLDANGRFGVLSTGQAWSLMEDLTVQATNTQAIHQGYPGLLDMYCAHVGVGEVTEPSGALMYEKKE